MNMNRKKRIKHFRKEIGEIMTLLEKFEEKILKEQETGSFELTNEKNSFSIYYSFMQRKVGSCRYVYGANSYYGEEYYSLLDVKYSLVAIVSENTIYLLDKCFFGLYGKDTIIPKSVMIFDNFVKKLNEDVAEYVFSDFYKNLENVNITEDEIYTDCKQKAKIYLLSGDSLKEQIKKDYFYSLSKTFTNQDAADILAGLKNKNEKAMEEFQKKEKEWSVRKATVQKIIDYAKDPEIVKNWEYDIANALNELKAKTVNVEFELNGKTASGKMDPFRILTVLKRELYSFCEFDFVPIKQGTKVFETLDAKTYGRENLLSCMNIKRITYGRKELYVRKDIKE